MIVVDSSVWIANLRDEDRPSVVKLRSISDTATVLVGDVVLLEVLSGARDDRHAARLEAYMRRFAIASMLTPELATRSAAHYRALRATGVTVRKTIDVVIATYCIVNDHVLLHDDRDFVPFARHLGLREY